MFEAAYPNVKIHDDQQEEKKLDGPDEGIQAVRSSVASPSLAAGDADVASDAGSEVFEMDEPTEATLEDLQALRLEKFFETPEVGGERHGCVGSFGPTVAP